MIRNNKPIPAPTIAAVKASANINVTVPINKIIATPDQEDALGFVPGRYPGQYLSIRRDGIEAITKFPPEVKGIRELGPFDWVLLQWDGVANWHRVYDGGGGSHD